MTYAEVELDFQFTDLTTKRLTYGPFQINDANLTTLKSAIKELNANGNYDWSYYANEAGAVIMPGGQGYPNVPIVNAAIIARDESELNL